MPTGALTEYLDVAQVVLYVFWVFFAGLIFYLRREDKREGYPLDSDRDDRSPVVVQGWPPMPDPKTFVMRQGHTYQAPPGIVETRPIAAVPVARWPGAPLQPTGNPMVDGVGPASYAQRLDEPDLTFEDVPRIVPLRADRGFFVSRRDPDPRGMPVIAADKQVAGIVREIWVDRSEPAVRFYEVELASGGQRVLLPYTFARLDRRRRQINVKSILAHQFAAVPPIKSPDQITMLEEDRIYGYFAGGLMYATPARLGPVL